MEGISFPCVVSRGCGIDIHKKVVVATIDGSGIRRETREYNTFTNSLIELRDWLLANEITHVAMESTGVYWKPVYKVLEPAGLTVWVVNARHIKYVPGHKTDKADSAWICKLLLAGLLKPSFIPAREQRELRDLTRYRTKLIQHVASEKNRTMRILEDCNIKLSSVLSSTSGVTATRLIDLICQGRHVTMSDIEQIYNCRLKASKDELYEACNGLVEEHHIYMLSIIRWDIIQTESIIMELNTRIKQILSVCDNTLQTLTRVPGLGTKNVEDLVAEIGLDMSVFPSAKHLASWAGMCPGNNESAGKKKSGRITHGNKQVKTIITEAAWAAIHTKGTFYSARYRKLAARRGKKRAIIAVGHSILKSIYYILKDEQEYRELGAEYINERVAYRRKTYLRKELELLGYNVELSMKAKQPTSA